MEFEEFLRACETVKAGCRRLADCQECPLQGACSRIPEKWPVPERWPPEKGGAQDGTQT